MDILLCLRSKLLHVACLPKASIFNFLIYLYTDVKRYDNTNDQIVVITFKRTDGLLWRSDEIYVH